MLTLKQIGDLKMMSIIECYLQKLGVLGHDVSYLEGLKTCEMLVKDHGYTLDQAQEYYCQIYSESSYDYDQFLLGFGDYLTTMEEGL
jgi:hypothetical protein